MPIPDALHYYFKSTNSRYRVHVGCKGSLLMVSCQGVARLKMDVQKLMVERKHFGLKFHLLANSRELVDLILFTNRAEIKEVRIRVDGKDIPTVSEAMYRAAESATQGPDAGAATMVQAPPGMGLAAELSTPATLPPEKDEVLDRLAILTGSGLHPAVGRGSGAVTTGGAATPSQGIRIDPGQDIVPPLLGENEPTPAHALPPVPPIEKSPPVSGKPAGKSGLKSGIKASLAAAVPNAPSAGAAKPAQKSGLAPAARSAAQPSVADQDKPAPSAPDAAVKPNKNAIAPAGELQVPDGLDDLLAAADEDNGKKKK